MSNLSQFGGGGGPVGSQVLMSDLGPTVTLADNSTWMRAGTVATTASVPQLALLPQYKVVEPTATLTSNPPNNANWSYSMASNGANIIVSCTGSTMLNRSADGGVTWTSITSGLGGTSYYYNNNIVYANGRFVTIGQSTYSYYVVTSTDGLTWTGITISPPTNWTTTANAGASVAWTGSYFGVATGWYDNTSTYYGALTYRGLNSSASAISFNYNSGFRFAVSGIDNFNTSAPQPKVSSDGAGGVVINTTGGSSGTQYVYSTSHGSTFTAYPMSGIAPPGYTPASMSILSTALIGTKLFMSITANNAPAGFYVYSTPTSTTPTLVTSAGATGSLANFIITGFTTGSKLFIYNSTLQQIFEMDTTNYTTVVSTKQLLYPAYVYGVTSNKFFTNSAYSNSPFTPYVYDTTFSNVTYYGIVKVTGTYTQQYVRIS